MRHNKRNTTDTTFHTNRTMTNPDARTDPRVHDGHESWRAMCTLLGCPLSIEPTQSYEPEPTTRSVEGAADATSPTTTDSSLTTVSVIPILAAETVSGAEVEP